MDGWPHLEQTRQTYMNSHHQSHSISNILQLHLACTRCEILSLLDRIRSYQHRTHHFSSHQRGPFPRFVLGRTAVNYRPNAGTARVVSLLNFCPIPCFLNHWHRLQQTTSSRSFNNTQLALRVIEFIHQLVIHTRSSSAGCCESHYLRSPSVPEWSDPTFLHTL